MEKQAGGQQQKKKKKNKRRPSEEEGRETRAERRGEQSARTCAFPFGKIGASPFGHQL